MKKLILILFAGFPLFLFGFNAYDVQVTQRNSGNTAFQTFTIPVTTNSVMVLGTTTPSMAVGPGLASTFGLVRGPGSSATNGLTTYADTTGSSIISSTVTLSTGASPILSGAAQVNNFRNDGNYQYIIGTTTNSYGIAVSGGTGDLIFDHLSSGTVLDFDKTTGQPSFPYLGTGVVHSSLGRLLVGTTQITEGGTGAITATSAFNALAPVPTSTGSMLFYDGTNWAQLSKGSNGTFAGVSGGVLGFYTPAGGGNVSNVATPTNGQLAQWTSATTIQGLAVTGSGNGVLATAPTITGGAHTGITNLAIRDTSAAFDVTLAATSSTALTAGRTLTFDTVNAARTLKLTGNPTINDWFDQSVKTTATPVFAGATITGATTISGALTATNGSFTFPVYVNRTTNDGTSAKLQISGDVSIQNATMFIGTTSANPQLLSDGTSTGISIANGGINSASVGGPTGTLNRNGSDGSIVAFNRSAVTVGSISVTTTATSFNTSSDARLKQNFRSHKSARDKIDALEVGSFDWIRGGKGFGVRAQDAFKVIPEVVTKGDDDMSLKPGDEGFKQWQVDYSKFVPYLIVDSQDYHRRVDKIDQCLNIEIRRLLNFIHAFEVFALVNFILIVLLFLRRK